MASNYYDSVDIETSSPWRDIVCTDRALRIVRDILRSVKKRYFNGRTDLRWADVGCGLGRSYWVACELGIDYTGIDSSVKHVEYCRARYPNGKFCCEDWLSHEGRYELVTFFSTLHHIQDWQLAIKRAIDLLSLGGILIVDHEPTRFYARLFRVYSKIIRKADPELIGEVEIHWFKYPSILADELPDGEVQYHFDFVPVFGRLGLRTSFKPIGRFFESYRKIIQKR